MHSFLRAVGFSDRHLTENDIDRLLDDISSGYDNAVSVIGSDRSSAFMELSRSFGKGFGIRICGEKDGDGFHRTTYFPYVTGDKVTSEENVAVQLRAQGDSYTCVLDDGRVGASLIFALQNPGDYRRELRLGRLEDTRITTSLSALSLGGMILLPVQTDAETEEKNREFYDKRSNIVARAKKGDEQAMEELTLQDVDLYARLQGLADTDDILSIVETYFIPYGMESDQYRILGIIKDVRTEENSLTGDEVVIMHLECNGMPITVCVNRRDLMGDPAAGRRFKGNIWLQGKLNFRALNAVLKEQKT